MYIYYYIYVYIYIIYIYISVCHVCSSPVVCDGTISQLEGLALVMSFLRRQKRGNINYAVVEASSSNMKCPNFACNVDSPVVDE